MSIKVIFAASEAAPFCKTGGLADVAGALPQALTSLGAEVTLLLPYYRAVAESGEVVEPTGIKFEVPVGRRIIECELFRTDSGGVDVYFLKRDEYFDRSELYGTASSGDYFDNLERYTFFSRGIFEAAKALKISPDIIHSNDWQTGLVSPYLKDTYGKDPVFSKTSSVFTVHNLAYQGIFDASLYHVLNLPRRHFGLAGLEFFDQICLLKAGLAYSDAITTVSPTYAKEIRTKRLGFGHDGILKFRKDELHGILNGVDQTVWDPASDKALPFNYSADKVSGKKSCKAALLNEFSMKKTRAPLVGMISRLVDQKGFDLIRKSIDDIMSLGISIVLLGSGEKRYEDFFRGLVTAYPGRVGVKIGYDEALAHRIEAGADIFLMPSRFEPCGLNQMYSLRYGTIPVVHATGGLNDSIRDIREPDANGFKFKGLNGKKLVDKLAEAVIFYSNKPAWAALVKRAMSDDHSWQASARKYLSLYEKLEELLHKK